MASERDTARSGQASVVDLGRARRPIEAVYTAVADATDRAPLEIEPLAGVIDPDALDALLGAPNRPRSSVTVRFEYGGCLVTATARVVRVEPRT